MRRKAESPWSTSWDFEVPSTKEAIAVLEAMGSSGRVLVVLGEEDGYADRSFGNLRDVQTIVVGELNAYDILVNDWVIFTDETLPGGAAVFTERDDETEDDATNQSEAEDEAIGEAAEEDAS